MNKMYTSFCLLKAIHPLEFTLNGDRISLSFVEAVVQTPSVAKGGISKDLRVFPAECRGRRCTYRGRLVVCDTNTSITLLMALTNSTHDCLC